MNIKLIVFGKTKSEHLSALEKNYEKRLKHYCNFEEIILKNIKNVKNMSKNELKLKEGKLILNLIHSSDNVFLLDNKGEQFSSEELSNFIKKKYKSTRTLIFIIGGAFGHSDELHYKFKYKLSISKMTFSHQMVKLIFKEQLYRAFTIIKNEKYHH